MEAAIIVAIELEVAVAVAVAVEERMTRAEIIIAVVVACW